VILGCGPDAARAYPYTVVADGAASYIKIDAPDHPLHLAFRPDGSLDPGATGPYQVHGRYTTGQDENDNFTFAPMEQTCNLAALAPSHEIPMTGGVSGAMASAAIRPGSNNSGTLSTPAAPLGIATLQTRWWRWNRRRESSSGAFSWSIMTCGTMTPPRRRWLHRSC